MRNVCMREACAALVFLLPLWGSLCPAYAETVTTKTVIQQKELPATKRVDFSAFDLDGNRILSMREVGEKLFSLFDTDGNMTIDNIEFGQRKVMTIIPMERRDYIFVDEDDNGTTDSASFTYETFIAQSGLMRFDGNADGLSPAEFVGLSFREMDTDDSKVIELDEWKKAYTASTLPPVAEQDRYN